MKVLITGAAGQLGQALQATLPPGHDLVAIDVADLDVTQAAAVHEYVGKSSPQLIINAAAYTQVDRAESERERAFAVNADAPAHLAEAARALGARLIHISTDYVFDGRGSRPYRPDDATAPINVYGESKLEGEQRAAAIGGKLTTIVRTAWLYSMHGSNFVNTMLRLMRERDKISVVADQVGTPTWATTLARALWAVAQRPALHGIYHWTDDGTVSWYDFARAIQDEAMAVGLLTRAAKIEPIRSAEYPTPARRPCYGVLDKTKTVADFGVALMPWRTALQQMLTQVKHA